MCSYKLDFYDVSQEVIGAYLQHFPDSIVASNLKACNHYRLYNGKAAETELKALLGKIGPDTHFGDDLINHNLVRIILQICVGNFVLFY